MTPIAVWSPSAATVTIITAEGSFAVPERTTLAFADQLDRVHQLMRGAGTASFSLTGDGGWMRIEVRDLADLAAGIRAAFAIPAHRDALLAESGA